MNEAGRTTRGALGRRAHRGHGLLLVIVGVVLAIVTVVALARKVYSSRVSGTVEGALVGADLVYCTPGACCGSPKFKTAMGPACSDVDYFVTAKAPNFNKFQQSSTRRPQTIQQESLRIHRIP